MHDNRNQSPQREDALSQRAVLDLVLTEHPTLLASSEIEREIGPGDAVERAIRDLDAVGLLRRDGGSILPTRAALHFDRLAG